MFAIADEFFLVFLMEREGSKDRAIGREPELRGEFIHPFFLPRLFCCFFAGDQ